MSNPRVRVLKDGKWATNPPFDDHLVLKKGEVRNDIEEKHVAGLVKYSYVELVGKAENPKVEESTTEILDELKEQEICDISEKGEIVTHPVLSTTTSTKPKTNGKKKNKKK